ARIVYAKNGDIYLWQNGSSVQLDSNPFTQQNPRISGSVVVWEDLRNDAGTGTNIDLYGFDLSQNQEIAVETSLGNQYIHDVNGNDVAFTDNRGGNNQVWILHFDNGTGGTGTGDPCDPANGAPVLFEKT